MVVLVLVWVRPPGVTRLDLLVYDLLLPQRDQVGDPAAVSALKELNKDLLKGGETVRINMKLRLPGKPVN